MSQKNGNNLLIVTFDQWRGDWVDPYNHAIELRNYNKLSEKAWTARYCYTSSPQCVPARMSWITGLYPSKLGVTKNCAANLPSNAPSIIRDIRDKGWRTEIIGKTHWTRHDIEYDLSNNKSLLRDLGFNYSQEIAGPRALRRIDCELTRTWKEQGFMEKYIEDMNKRYGRGRCRDAWQVRSSVLPNHLYPDIWITDQAIKRIGGLPNEQQWIMWVSYVGPHEPFDTPSQWKEKGKFKNQEYIRRGKWINELPKTCELRSQAEKWEGILMKKDIEELREDYAMNLRMLDDQLGRLINAVMKRKDSDNTAIVLTADHGEMLGDHEMLYKSTFLEASIRVPFVFKPALNTGLVEKATIYEKPVSLTKCFKAALNCAIEKENCEMMERRAAVKSPIIIEFGEEIALIKSKIKVCMDSNGNAIWATDLRQKRDEARNILKENISYKQRNRLNKLLSYGTKVIKQRKSSMWRILDVKTKS